MSVSTQRDKQIDKDLAKLDEQSSEVNHTGLQVSISL